MSVASENWIPNDQNGKTNKESERIEGNESKQVKKENQIKFSKLN